MNKANTQQKTTYTLADVGCYVDGARGIYAIDAIVDFAESHGCSPKDCDKSDHTHSTTCFDSRFASCEFANEVEDEIDSWMNDNYGVEGAYWGRTEQGDWGLWTNEEN